MAIIQPLLQELEHEAQTTRRVLERVPEEHLGWKPHPKSYSLGQLALHVAQLPRLYDFGCGFHPRCSSGTRSSTRRVVWASCSSSCNSG